MKQKDSWFVKFRDRMDGYTETPPSDVWEMLEKDLSLQKGLKWNFYFYRVVAAAAVILLLISAGLYFTIYTSPDPRTMEALHTPKAILKNRTLDVPDSGGRADLKIQVKHRLVVKAESIVPLEVTDGIVLLPADTVSLLPADIPEETLEKEKTQRSGNRQPKVLVFREDYKIEKSPKSSRKWSVGISAGNSLIASAENHYGFSNLNRTRMMPEAMGLSQLSPEESAEGAKVAAAYQQIMLRNINTQTTTSVKHRFPVTFGVSLRKNIAERFLLETGIVYTLLSSELKTDGDIYYSQEQKLHYMGIPLKAGWSFIEKKRFSLYLSAGGMVEKCIKSQLKTHYEMQNENSFVKGDRLSVNNLQWSLLATAGIQLNVTDHFGIYAEPGIVYYFDDGTDVSTIRKEKPFNVNLQMGLRFGF